MPATSWIRTFAVLGSAAGFCSAICQDAHGQLNLVDQQRSLTANATGLAGSGLFGTGIPFGTQSTNSDISTATGNYTNTLSASKTDSPNDGTGDQDTYNVSSSAMQTSTLSSAVLSAYSTVNASAVLLPVSGGTGFQADGLGQASFNVDFTVSTPTAFNLTGDVTGNAIYHLGRLEIISADVTLSGSSSGSLYSVGFAPTGYTYPGESFNDPVSFSTTLLPGQTYTLNAAASVDSGRDGVGETNVGPANASFEFVGIVPEPDCLAAIVIVPMLLRRKLQKTLIFQ